MAGPSYGSDSWVGIGDESGWATPVTRTAFFEPVNCTLDASVTYGRSKVVTGIDAKRQYRSGESAAGDVVLELGYSGYMKWLKHLLGDVASAAITAAQSYRHQFARAANLPAGMTVEVNRGLHNMLYPGCKINQGVLRWTPGEPLSATFSLVGKNGSANGSPSTPTYIATERMISPDNAVLTIGGADYTAYVRSVECTIPNALKTDRRMIGSLYNREPVRGSEVPEVVWRIDMEFWDETEAVKTAYLAGTEVEVTLTLDSGNNIGASTDKYLMKIETPKGYIRSCSTPVSDKGIISMSIEIGTLSALDTDFDLDSNQAGAIKITVQNSEASA